MYNRSGIGRELVMMKTIFSLGKWLEIAAAEGELKLRLFKKTVFFDWGRIFEGGLDGDIQVTHRVWGIRGSRWLYVAKPTERYRIERDWWKEQQEFFREKQERIQQGKELDPLMMTQRLTQQQRHAATARVVAQMKWSDTFVKAMTTPLMLQALENGGRVRSLIPTDAHGVGTEWEMNPEQMKQVEGMTRADFAKAIKDRRQQHGRFRLGEVPHEGWF
jgi:hypothetical protein